MHALTITGVNYKNEKHSIHTRDHEEEKNQTAHQRQNCRRGKTLFNTANSHKAENTWFFWVMLTAIHILRLFDPLVCILGRIFFFFFAEML